MLFKLCPRDVLKVNLYLILFLLIANTVGIIFKHYLGHDHVYGLVGLFDFNSEKNVPTLYSTIALLCASALLTLIAVTHRKAGLGYLQWAGLAVIFFFLSIDEISSIHERFTDPTKGALQTTGFLHYAWVIPYGIALAVFVVAYLKFLIELPKHIAVLFIASGAVFVAGAIGLEMIGGRHAQLHGEDDLPYAVLYTMEELLEMLGIALFIYTLLRYIVEKYGALTVGVEATNTGQSPTQLIHCPPSTL